jgi:hypothetical protein
MSAPAEEAANDGKEGESRGDGTILIPNTTTKVDFDSLDTITDTLLRTQCRIELSRK